MTNEVLQAVEISQAVSILWWILSFIVLILGIVGTIGGLIFKIKREIEEKTQRAEDKIDFHAEKQERIVSKYAENTNNAIIQLQEAIHDNTLKTNDALGTTKDLEKRMDRIETWKDKITDGVIKGIR